MRHAIDSNVDQQTTAANVAAFLDDYPYMKHLAMSGNTLRSAQLDDMPRATVNMTAVEHGLDRRLDAQQYVAACDETLERVRVLASGSEAAVVKYTYFQGLAPSQAMERSGYSSSQYYRLRPRALVHFALYWPLDTPQLIIRHRQQ